MYIEEGSWIETPRYMKKQLGYKCLTQGQSFALGLKSMELGALWPGSGAQHTPKQAFLEALKLSPVFLTCMTILKGIIFPSSPPPRGCWDVSSFPVLFFDFFVLFCFSSQTLVKLPLQFLVSPFLKVIYFNETKTEVTMVIVKSYRMTRHWRQSKGWVKGTEKWVRKIA